MYVYIYIYTDRATPCEFSRSVMGPYFIGIKRWGTSRRTGSSIKWEPMTLLGRVYLYKMKHVKFVEDIT